MKSLPLGLLLACGTLVVIKMVRSETGSTGECLSDCPRDWTGWHQDCERCDGYVVCERGRKHDMLCPPGTVWDQGLKACVHEGESTTCSKAGGGGGGGSDANEPETTEATEEEPATTQAPLEPEPTTEAIEEGPATAQAQLERAQGDIIQTIQLPLDTQSNHVVGMAVVDRTLFLVHSQANSLMYAINLDDTTDWQQFTVDGLDRAKCMTAMTNPTRIVIIEYKTTMFNDNNLHLISMTRSSGSGWQMASQLKISLNYAPLGVSTEGQTLLVCGEDNYIHVVTDAGLQIGLIAPAGVTSVWEAVPCHLPQCYIVLDAVGRTLVRISQDGSEKATFSSSDWKFSPGAGSIGVITSTASLYVCHQYVADIWVLGLEVTDVIHDGRSANRITSLNSLYSAIVTMYVDDSSGLLYVTSRDKVTGRHQVTELVG